MSEIDWVIARSRLYEMWLESPNFSISQYGTELNRSERWVRKWVKKFKERKEQSMNGIKMFAREKTKEHQRERIINEEIKRKVINIRLTPHKEVWRIPGAKAIQYLWTECGKGDGLYCPGATKIYEILHEANCIAKKQKRARQPEELPEPMTEMQMDFKSISSVPPEENGKQQHVVETLNIIDKGTSILVAAVPRDDYHAGTVITTLIDVFMEHGIPNSLQFDRDPRFVGGWQATEFPTALLKLLACLGIEIKVTPPRRPDKNGTVERANGTYEKECLCRKKPTDLTSTEEVTKEFLTYYNHDRPHQGIACQNRPPRVVFPDARCPHILPTEIDPDAWLQWAAVRPYSRRLNKNGSMRIGRQSYYVTKKFAKQKVIIHVDPIEKELIVSADDGSLIRRLSIKGLSQGVISLDQYVTQITQEALSEARTAQARQRKKNRQTG